MGRYKIWLFRDVDQNPGRGIVVKRRTSPLDDSMELNLPCFHRYVYRVIGDAFGLG